ncbi:hypothetical protein LTR16_012228, partial [Cryomyces antarcticus]
VRARARKMQRRAVLQGGRASSLVMKATSLLERGSGAGRRPADGHSRLVIPQQSRFVMSNLELPAST